MTTMILAGSYAEGARFAGSAGIRGPRIVAAPDSAINVRVDVILELESFERRPDRHRIEGHIRNAHFAAFVPDPIRMLVDAETVQALKPVPVAAPHQTTVDEQVALAEKDRLRGVQAIDQAAAPQVQPRPAAPAAYKARSRAKGKR